MERIISLHEIIRNTKFCASCPENLCHTINDIIFHMVQRNSSTRVNLAEQMPYFTGRSIDSDTKPFCEFRSCVGIKGGEPDIILFPTKNLNRCHGHHYFLSPELDALLMRRTGSVSCQHRRPHIPSGQTEFHPQISRSHKLAIESLNSANRNKIARDFIPVTKGGGAAILGA